MKRERSLDNNRSKANYLLVMSVFEKMAVMLAPSPPAALQLCSMLGAFSYSILNRLLILSFMIRIV